MSAFAGSVYPFVESVVVVGSVVVGVNDMSTSPGCPSAILTPGLQTV